MKSISNRHSIPEQERSMSTYILDVSVEEEDDGRWSAWIDALSGCNAWGHTKDEALDALRENAKAYIEVMIEKGQTVPHTKGITTTNTPAVAVTV